MPTGTGMFAMHARGLPSSRLVVASSRRPGPSYAPRDARPRPRTDDHDHRRPTIPTPGRRRPRRCRRPDRRPRRRSRRRPAAMPAFTLPIDFGLAAPADECSRRTSTSSTRSATLAARPRAQRRGRAAQRDVAAAPRAEAARRRVAQDAARPRRDAHAAAARPRSRRTSTRAAARLDDRDHRRSRARPRSSTAGSQLHVLGSFG